MKTEIDKVNELKKTVKIDNDIIELLKDKISIQDKMIINLKKQIKNLEK